VLEDGIFCPWWCVKCGEDVKKEEAREFYRFHGGDDPENTRRPKRIRAGKRIHYYEGCD
jgi:hypothetical protein